MDLFSSLIGEPGTPKRNVEEFDNSEIIYINPECLLSMIKHARAGVPLEVMGLMIGEHVDKYSINLKKVFSMPQVGTGVNVSAIDHPFQTEMVALLEQIKMPHISIGWYHSHPGFGCWLSHTDIACHKTFETVDPRAIAIVIDPIQSVKGKVVIDAFRSIDNSNQSMFSFQMGGTTPSRLTTSLAPYEQKPTITALIRGLNKLYYSVNIKYKISSLEKQLLTRISKKSWTQSLVYDVLFKRELGEEMSKGDFEFEDIKMSQSKSKAQEEFIEKENEASQKSSKNIFLKKLDGNKPKLLKNQFDSCEKFELSSKKDIEEINDYIEKKSNKRVIDEDILKFHDNQKGDEKEKNKTGDEKEEEVEHIDLKKEVLDKIKMQKIGKTNYLRAMLEKVKKVRNEKKQELLKLSRIGLIFDMPGAGKIYSEMIETHN